MSIAFLFPGQGAQSPGMLRALPDHPAVKATLAEASAILKQAVDTIDTESAFASTANVQLAITITGVAVARALEAEGAVPEAVAGLSIGAFPAAVASGALDFADAVPLVKLRGTLMQNAFPTGHGLVSILGLDERQVAAIVEQVSTEQAPAYIANLNAPRQVVIAGADATLAAVLAAARDAGARKAQQLAVTVPSPCPLLAGVAEQLTEALRAIPMRAARAAYVGNRTARALRDPEAIRQDLATNVAHPVRWHDATTVLFELGARLFIELPPGDVLSRLAAEAFPDARSVSIASDGLNTALTLTRSQENTSA